MAGITSFDKAPLGAGKLLALLRERGLEVNDEPLAYHALNRIGFYRLTGYFLPFQNVRSPFSPHNFHQGTKFEDVMALYSFDTEMRSLVSQALEKLEVAIRTSICEFMCAKYGAHWYVDARSLEVGKHTAIMDEAAKHLDFDLQNSRPFWQEPDAASRKAKQLFLAHYYAKYNDPKMPPAWMLRELATFGFWARLYDALTPADKKQVANAWRYPDGTRIDDELLASWFWSLSILRNRCSHHTRITSRHFPFPPKLPAKNPSKDLFYSKTDDLHTLLVIIRILINSAYPSYDWKGEIMKLFKKYQYVNIEKATGFSLEGKDFWGQTVFWTLN